MPGHLLLRQLLRPRRHPYPFPHPHHHPLKLLVSARQRSDTTSPPQPPSLPERYVRQNKNKINPHDVDQESTGSNIPLPFAFPCRLSYVHRAGSEPLLYLSMGQLVERAARRYGEREALVSVEEGVRLSYRQLLHQVLLSTPSIILFNHNIKWST